MSMEGRRQFIPREAGDLELTQAELDAKQDAEHGKLPQFMRTAAFATALGAAALSPEVAYAQQPELERQNIERMQIRITEETSLESCVSAMAEADPTLKPFLKGARVEEAEAKSEAKNSERTFYVYLPSKEQILAVKIDVAQLERADGDSGQRQFAV